MMVTHKVSIILPLPVAYRDRIADGARGPGRSRYANWFGGIYQDPKNFFPPDGGGRRRPSSTSTPSTVLPAEQKKAWLADRTGAIVGRATADRFGWKVGDKIPIQETIYRHPDGGQHWEFNLVGIYDGAQKGTDTSGFYFRYDYLKEADGRQPSATRSAGTSSASPTRRARGDVAKRIDAQFANSPAETKTQTEKAMAQSFANQVGNIGSSGHRDRWRRSSSPSCWWPATPWRSRCASARASWRCSRPWASPTARCSRWCSPSRARVAVLGGPGLGIALGWWLITGIGDPTHGSLPVFFLPPRGHRAGRRAGRCCSASRPALPPAVQAMRLRIVDALRRV